ncbi:hypothetical protein, variant 3 [Cryptococcus amylolentus CBS 6039]|uniref:HMG box domain-containing protein n=1 Tax=Cryptococcus amylolentus CBS 6039 TaxID=1295533 RepID=A0A1E3HNZ6_9TREE|nr:hypothetical protein, variant 2 [Cryptococcus amylolentus CBS 6039]XP_018993304.1 hypothetical protein, variant 3 [Cryptococcus amylolentus CBS 6039]ODN78067.1 hypothetical protein, variant 2 [Cryptococcus amylolentus CBS 6039]ODN78068.1 hypothetical protein, variant 3 [Cryptococcus amylolentus CBS 6039]
MLTAAADKKEVKKAAPKQKREKMDPNKPKQALSAYMFFDQDNRERIMAEYPGATFDHVGKLLGLRWKEMSDSEKEPYYKKAAADITRAEKDSAAYKADSHP